VVEEERVMPNYEFECDTCGLVVEKFYRSIPRVNPLHITRECEQCGGLTAKRILSRCAFHLMPGKVSWGEERFSSASKKGSDVVELNEPE